MAKPLDSVPDIQRVAAALLRKAGIEERLPTPAEDIVAAAGLVEDADFVLSESKIREAPRELRRLLRAAGRKIRGALDRHERIVHINPTVQVPAQRRFIRCHEVMHHVLPWQRDLLVLGDTAKTLSPQMNIRFEREANQGAAELLFQLDLHERIARDYPTDITTPIALAEMFGASIHSSFRRWIERHNGTVCGVVIDPTPISADPLTFRRREVVASSLWRDRFSDRCFPSRLRAADYPFVATATSPWASEDEGVWSLLDRTGSATTLRVQSFCNTYRTFLLFWVPARDRLLARRRSTTRLVVG